MKSFSYSLLFSLGIALLLSFHIYLDTPYKNEQTRHLQRWPASEKREQSCEKKASFFGPFIGLFYRSLDDFEGWKGLDSTKVASARKYYEGQTAFSSADNSTTLYLKQQTKMPETPEEFIGYMDTIMAHNLGEGKAFTKIAEIKKIDIDETKVKWIGRSKKKYRAWRIRRAIKSFYGKSFTGKLKNLIKFNQKLTTEDIENFSLEFAYNLYGRRSQSKDIEKALSRVVMEKMFTEGMVQMAKESSFFLERPHFLYKFMSSEYGKNLLNRLILVSYVVAQQALPYFPRIRSTFNTTRANRDVQEAFKEVVKMGWKNASEKSKKTLAHAWTPELKGERFIEEAFAPFFSVATWVYLIYAQGHFILEKDAGFDEQKKIIDRANLKLTKILQMADDLEGEGFKIYSDRGQMRQKVKGICALLEDCFTAHSIPKKERGKQKERGVEEKCRAWLDPQDSCAHF